MKKKLLVMTSIMLLLLSSGCSTSSTKKSLSTKTLFTEKEDKYSVSAIEKRNFKEAKNIPADDNFDIKADRLTGKYCTAISEIYYKNKSGKEYFPNRPTISNFPSAIQIYFDFYENESHYTYTTNENDWINPNMTYAKIGFIHYKETMNYTDAKKEYSYLWKNVIKYFGKKSIIDHSNEKNWTPQYDNENEIFSIKLVKPNPAYEINEGDYQLDLSLNLYSLNHNLKNMNIENVKNGFIWLGLDDYYNSEYKCLDAFKMLYTIPWQEAMKKIEQLDVENDDYSEEIEKISKKIKTFPFATFSDALSEQKEITFYENGCVLL